MLIRTASPENTIALHAAEAEAGIALCASLPVPDGEVPDWIHLLPAGALTTVDGRGPYTVSDAQALMAQSLPEGERLIIDENHATDKAAPRGEPAPARGWIVGLEQRDSGIWGKVEWTPTGRQLMGEKAYRAISPAIAHDKNMRVTAIRRASLVNLPNLKGLTTLHSENSMTLLEKLLKALGLDASTNEDTLVTAITTLHSASKDTKVALQSQLAPIAKAVGLKDGADAVEILGAVSTLAANGGDQKTIIALQSELVDVTGKLNTLSQSIAKDKATTFVDGAIKAGKVSVKPMRDHYITMHMADPARVEKEIGAMPALTPSGATVLPPPEADGTPGLTEADNAVIAMMNLDPKEFLKTKAKIGHAEATL